VVRLNRRNALIAWSVLRLLSRLQRGRKRSHKVRNSAIAAALAAAAGAAVVWWRLYGGSGGDDEVIE
jgi:hypothetical protein